MLFNDGLPIQLQAQDHRLAVLPRDHVVAEYMWKVAKHTQPQPLTGIAIHEGTRLEATRDVGAKALPETTGYLAVGSRIGFLGKRMNCVTASQG
jgi:hypothetical protein